MIKLMPLLFLLIQFIPQEMPPLDNKMNEQACSICINNNQCLSKEVCVKFDRRKNSGCCIRID